MPTGYYNKSISTNNRKESMLLNPVIATLHNAQTDRWHPILFIESPLPGGALPVRHKSKGHHTVGFDTKSASDNYAKTELSSQAGGAAFMPNAVFEWSGCDVPAIVHFFDHPATAAN